MIQHLLKLVWNRKRLNTLLLVEILASFVVLFAVILSSIVYLNRYLAPDGFDHENVYSITLNVDYMVFIRSWDETMYNHIVNALREFNLEPEIEAIATFVPIPYGGSAYITVFEYEGTQVASQLMYSSDDAIDVFKIEMLDGRWFSSEDDALEFEPLVVTQRFAEEMFGQEDPVGKIIMDDDVEYRVVGLIEDFRKDGPLGRLQPFVLLRQSLENFSDTPISSFLVRIEDDISFSFEEEMADRLEELVPYPISIELLSESRVQGMKEAIQPLIVSILLVVSMIFIVILGMIGIFWQTITRRTEEIGLRRALGGSRRRIYFQLIVEIALLTSLAVIVGSVVLIQLPFFGVFGDIPFNTVVIAILLSATTVYLLSIFSGLYPAWMASRVQPAVALHYE